jgi:hypothetical protein
MGHVSGYGSAMSEAVFSDWWHGFWVGWLCCTQLFALVGLVVHAFRGNLQPRWPKWM